VTASRNASQRMIIHASFIASHDHAAPALLLQ
jgi:hypothetical protein